MVPGIVVGVVGAAILLAMILIRRKMDGKPAIVFNGKAIGIALLGVAGAIVLSAGMCMTMVWGMMIPGILVGIIGIVALLCLIPRGQGIKAGKLAPRFALPIFVGDNNSLQALKAINL